MAILLSVLPPPFSFLIGPSTIIRDFELLFTDQSANQDSWKHGSLLTSLLLLNVLFPSWVDSSDCWVGDAVFGRGKECQVAVGRFEMDR